MQKLLKIGVAFLLIFIPLYPKLPLLDIWQTWVYIRLEDFLVALVAGVWLIQVARRKISLKTPLTIPIFAYWLIGGLSVAHAIFILANQMVDFFPHLALFHLARRLEYMVLFFIIAASIENLKTVKRYLGIIGFAFLAVCFYGLGQKYLGWPAFLTMNEEFAKGTPFILGPKSRLASTFGGHYDLAAYLVLMISLWASLFFGFKNKFLKIAIFLLTILGFFLLLLTASRISFAVYLIAITCVLWLHQKKWLILPVLILSIFLSQMVTGSAQRLAKTFRVERVVYDTRTGKPIATLEDFLAVSPTPTPSPMPTPAVTVRVKPSPPPVETPPPVVEEEEELPLGTGFLNLEGLTETEAKAQLVRQPIFTKSLETATISAQLATQSAEFLVKRALVYDISFTTRFQGEWPRAIEAFQRNLLLGSGFSSIALATDNDYLRALGETGILGLTSFLAILAVFGLLVRLALKKIRQPLGRSLLIGVSAGVLGMMINASLIDVFEASKVAFVFWLILGLAVGTIDLLIPGKKNLAQEWREVWQTPLAALFTLSLLAGLVFGPAFKNYFVGDDFTWLRWALETKPTEIWLYFTQAAGFFYRPLAKLYFYVVSPFFGLRPQGYHAVSLLIHFGCSVAAYFLARLLTKRPFLAFLTAVLFLVNPIVTESVFWIASTSHLFASFFYLWAFVAYLGWRQVKVNWRWPLLGLSFLAFGLALLAHEKAVTFPLMILTYELIFYQHRKSLFWHLPFWILLGVYFWVRNYLAGAHLLSGDYSYHWLKLPFNFGGNLAGYLGEVLVGARFLVIYDASRAYLQRRPWVALVILIMVTTVLIKFGKNFLKNKLVLFALIWVVVLLLPFLGLGNMAERYAYPAHLGILLIVGLLIARVGANLAWLKIGLLVSLAAFGIAEVNQARQEWFTAGEIANEVLRATATNYPKFPLNSHLYFTNLPIRQHRAWVFPVGLADALWFIYRDDTLNIHQIANPYQALDHAKSQSGPTFVFIYVDGELKQVKQ